MSDININVTPTPDDPVKTAAGEIAKDVLHVAAQVGPFIPVAFLPTALALADKFGPAIIDRLELIFTKQAPTWDDVRGVFAGLQPYEAFGIPDKVP